MEAQRPLFFGICEPKSNIGQWPQVDGYKKVGCKRGSVLGYLANGCELKHNSQASTRNMIVLDAPQDTFRLYHVYQSNKNAKIGQDGVSILQKIREEIAANPKRGFLIIGDLNAKSGKWDPCASRTNPAGALVEKIVKETGSIVLNQGQGPTYKKVINRKATSSVIDLAIASSCVEEMMSSSLISTHLSDHNILQVLQHSPSVDRKPARCREGMNPINTKRCTVLAH